MKTEKAAERASPMNPQHQPVPNIVETALRAGEQLARGVVPNPITDGKPFIVLKDADGAEMVKFLDERFEFPARKKGTVELNDAASFLEYWKRQKQADSSVYASMQPAQFLAVFDDHGAAPAYREHRALYVLGFAIEWNTWSAQDGKPFAGNETFAIWLENQVPDVVEPPGASLLEIALNLRVHSNAAFNNKVNLVNGKAEFAYTNAVEGSSDLASGKVAIPETFFIEIPVFAGIDAPKYRVEARFRYRLSSGKLALWYELVRPHKVIEQAFKDVLAVIQAGAETTCLFGSPE